MSQCSAKRRSYAATAGISAATTTTLEISHTQGSQASTCRPAPARSSEVTTALNTACTSSTVAQKPTSARRRSAGLRR